MKNFCIHLSDWLLNELNTLQKKDDRERSYIIRKILNEYVNNPKSIKLDANSNGKQELMIINLRLDESLYLKLKEIAYRYNYSNFNLFIRLILAEYIKKGI